jgi:hypothetical protein
MDRGREAVAVLGRQVQQYFPRDFNFVCSCSFGSKHAGKKSYEKELSYKGFRHAKVQQQVP